MVPNKLPACHACIFEDTDTETNIHKTCAIAYNNSHTYAKKIQVFSLHDPLLHCKRCWNFTFDAHNYFLHLENKTAFSLYT